MRTLGVGERAMELMIMEATNPKKKPFGKLKGEQGKIQWDISECRIDLEMCKRLVYYAANAMDAKGMWFWVLSSLIMSSGMVWLTWAMLNPGFKEARKEIAMAKIKVPRLVCNIVDCAIQVHGGLGISQSTELASMYAHLRTLRFADGPDEAHAQQLGNNLLTYMASCPFVIYDCRVNVSLQS